MKTSLLVVALLFLAGLMGAQAQRNVHWIHGIGGNGDSWQGFSNEFGGQRQMPVNTHNGYQTGNGLNDMATDIRGQIAGTAGGTAIGICHSMGGVAARQIDVQHTGLFGGIITFDSPFRGARVVTNVNNGVASDYIANAVHQLAKGPGRQYLLVPTLILEGLGTKFIDDFLGDWFVNSQRNQQNLTPATAADLAEESGYNQQFYGNSTLTPKLVYWGNEVSPIHVRLAAGSKNVNEQSWVNSYNDVRHYYGAMRDYNYARRWIPIISFALYSWRGDGWADGYNYLWDQSENEWSNLIGSGYSVPQTISEYVFIGENHDDYINCVGNTGNAQACESTYFQWVSRTINVFVRDQSDGLVPRRSQIAEGTSWTGNAEVIELPGNSHNEVRRSDDSKRELNRTFNGLTGQGRFSIPTR